MANNWEWPTCRRWSKQVFKLIADGRLPLCWDDPGAIKELQRDICMSASKLCAYQYTPQYSATQSGQFNSPYHAQPSPTVAPINPPPANMKSEYNKDTHGRPCHQWNGAGTVDLVHHMEICRLVSYTMALGARSGSKSYILIMSRTV